jgi:predicted nucleotidyltransferase
MYNVDMDSRITSVVRALASELGFVAVYLHGSHATASARPDSDIDLALLQPHGWSPTQLERALDRVAFGVAAALSVPRDGVDAQPLRDAPPGFRFRVVTTGRLLCVSDTTELARFQAYSICEHYDNEIFLRPIREAMRRRLAEGRFAS